MLGGIEVSPKTDANIYGNGTLSSSVGVLNFYLDRVLEGEKHSRIAVSSVITDYNSASVGLMVAGGRGAVSIEGSLSNTFTGNVEVAETLLVLYKTNGAIAVQRDILIRNEGMVRFQESNQVTRTASIVLRSNGILQTLSESNSDISNIFNHLVVKDSGILYFHHKYGISENSKYYIKINDLIINQGGHLEVHGWQEGRDFLLVRKTSAALEDALGKTSFAGYDRNNIHLEDFDSEYWSISGAPESAAYGALLGATGFGLVIWRRKRIANKHTAQ